MYNVVKAQVWAGSNLTEAFMGPRGKGIYAAILFSLFINELANETIQYGRQSIQLTPDLSEIFILLFADEVILAAYTVCGLQIQLNILRETAERLGLVVNKDKSNVIVFRNGSHIASCECWVYSENLMTIVNVYKHLGIYLSTRLTFSHMLNDMAMCAKKGVMGIFKLLWSLGERFPATFFKLFDTQIKPMLNYGVKVWGLDADDTLIEKIHLFAIKRFFNTSIRTPNVLVYSETGRHPPFISTHVKCIKFWLCI